MNAAQLPAYVYSFAIDLWLEWLQIFCYQCFWQQAPAQANAGHHFDGVEGLGGHADV